MANLVIHSTIVNYDSRVTRTRKLLIFTTLRRVVTYICKVCKRLARYLCLSLSLLLLVGVPLIYFWRYFENVYGWTEPFTSNRVESWTNNLPRAAAIAPWYCCAYHSAVVGSNPKHTIYAFSIQKKSSENKNLFAKKYKNKQKEAVIGPFFNNLPRVGQ